MNSIWYSLWVAFIWVYVPFLVYGHREWQTFVKFLFMWIWFFLLVPPIVGSLAFGPLSAVYSIVAYFLFFAITGLIAVPLSIFLNRCLQDNFQYLSRFARINIIGIVSFLFSANLIAFVFIQTAAWRNDFECLSYQLPIISVPTRTIHGTASKSDTIYIWSYSHMSFLNSGATRNGPATIDSACDLPR